MLRLLPGAQAHLPSPLLPFLLPSLLPFNSIASSRDPFLPLTVLKQSLRSLFKSYGEVLDVVAHSNLRMRGQAFVSFANKDIAGKAAKEVKGFPLYGKPMVSRSSQLLRS